MSLPGYHPICVLFQGNDCALDGTYRLVCRHQVRKRDFKPGDVVEVDMGQDDEEDAKQDEDVTVISDQDDERNNDGQRWRDAIALGDEMVMSLLRNMCKNQPTGKSPWSSSNHKMKRRRDQDEANASTKRVKSEPGVQECTTSQGRSDRVDSSQTDLLLQKVLSAVQSIQVSQDLVLSEMHSLQQTQRTLSSQVMAIQKSFVNLDETTSSKVPGYSAACDLAAMASVTPVSLYLSQTGTGSTHHTSEHHTSDSITCLGVSQLRQSPSTPSSSDSQPQIVISNATSEHQPSLATFPTQDSLTAMPSYHAQVAGTFYPNSQVPYNFRYTDDSETHVFLGHIDSPLTLTKNEMEDILFKTNTPASFAYRLTGKIFTNEELLLSNTSGNTSKKSGKHYRQLNPSFIEIILMEVESRFPSCRDTKECNKRLFTAINERCRNERKKVVYRSSGPINDSLLVITKTQSLSTL